MRIIGLRMQEVFYIPETHLMGVKNEAIFKLSLSMQKAFRHSRW